MANFKVKNHFKAESVKLVDATAYQVENGTWYMELQYEYEVLLSELFHTVNKTLLFPFKFPQYLLSADFEYSLTGRNFRQCF